MVLLPLTRSTNQGLPMKEYSSNKPRIYQPTRLIISYNEPRIVLGRIPITDDPSKPVKHARLSIAIKAPIRWKNERPPPIHKSFILQPSTHHSSFTSPYFCHQKKKLPSASFSYLCVTTVTSEAHPCRRASAELAIAGNGNNSVHHVDITAARPVGPVGMMKGLQL